MLGPPPFCLSVKLNSADYMAEGGLTQDEALDQVRWLLECGMIDFAEISGGNAEQTTSGLHKSVGKKTISQAPKMRESTRIREAYFTDFAERVIKLQKAKDNKVPIQLPGGFRSRTGMADAIDSGICDLIGLGRIAILEPSLPKAVLLNPAVGDEEAVAMAHIVRGRWLADMIPVKVIGSGLPIQQFYWNVRSRLGKGPGSDPHASIPYILWMNTLEILREKGEALATSLQSCLPLMLRRQHMKND